MQPSCWRSTRTGAAAGGSVAARRAKKMLLEASRIKRVWTLPITVHSRTVSSAPAPSVPSPAYALASGDAASTMQSTSSTVTSDSATTCSGPVMQRSSRTVVKGWSMTRLGAAGAAGLPSGCQRDSPGTSVQSRRTSVRGSLSAAAASCSAPPAMTRPSSTSVPRAPIVKRQRAGGCDQRPRAVAGRDDDLETRRIRERSQRRP